MCQAVTSIDVEADSPFTQGYSLWKDKHINIIVKLCERKADCWPMSGERPCIQKEGYERGRLAFDEQKEGRVLCRARKRKTWQTQKLGFS